MKTHALITAVGSDRIGIVDDIASAVLERDCNIEESRMALLGGEFAALLLVSGETAAIGRLLDETPALGAKLGLVANARRTADPAPVIDALPYLLESSSLDNPGIVHSVAAVLRHHGVNIADLETDTMPAPWTGAPMFTLRARLSIPKTVSISALRREFDTLETQQNLDLRLTPAVRMGGEA